MAAAALLSSCNEKDDSPYYADPANVAVTKFALKYNSNISGLDSTYFSIDLNRGVIFNADSLPKGTSVDKLVANITFSSDVTSAMINMTGGYTREGEIDYKSNPTDSIDFTGNVTLTLQAGDDMSRTYRIKVNVHKETADSLVWSEMSKGLLPSRLGNPVSQKTVELSGAAVTLLREKDGTYTIARSTDLMKNVWEKQEVTFPFEPDVRTFAASSDALYLLATDGKMHTSTDMLTWSDTGETWVSMIGAYGATVVGLRDKDGVRTFAQYPLQDLSETAVPADFPLTGLSNFVTLQNKWTSSPVAFFAGGKSASGALSGDTWAFDGQEWICLSKDELPAVQGASIIPYYSYRSSTSGQAMDEYSVWMLVGGRLADGTFNRDVYISFDNGVNWNVGATSLQLPAMIPAMTECDNVVMGTVKSADFADQWKVVKRVSYEVSGTTVTWNCPYIYLIGGYDSQQKLYDTIWRGVLTRLTFTPVF